MGETRIVPLGGLGQFGANATIIQTPETTILIDFGLMFPPDSRQPGVDYYVNDPEQLLENWPDLQAVFITHGHEDHIGGLNYLLRKRKVPIYATSYTLELIRSADPMIKKPELREVEAGQPVVLGDISVEYIPVTHSIAHASCLAIRTQDGLILHSGDFKLDPEPGDGAFFGSRRLGELAEEGVDLLMMDSTNAEQKGFSGSESDLLESYRSIFRQSKGRVLISTFSSSLPRLINVSRVASEFNRKVALLGRSFVRHFNAATKSGYIPPDHTIISIEEASDLPVEQQVFFVTGSQGEVNASLTKIAMKSHPKLKLSSRDTVVFASRAIPGNERAIALLRSYIERCGAEVITTKHMNVHVSGHAYREELAYLFNLVKPRSVMPIHGEYTMLNQHYGWLKHLIGSHHDILLKSNGDEIRLRRGRLSDGPHWDLDLIPIDGNQLVPVSRKALKQRKDMMYSGVVIVVATRDFGKMSWDVDTLGIAEEQEDRLKNLVLDFLRRHGKYATGRHLKRDLKKAIRPHFSGMPVIKIIWEGTIL